MRSFLQKYLNCWDLYRNCKISVKSKKINTDKITGIPGRFFIIILGLNSQNIIDSTNQTYWFSQIQIGKDGFAAENAG